MGKLVKKYFVYSMLIIGLSLLMACNQAQPSKPEVVTDTPVTPTDTPVTPTDTPVKLTDTPLPPVITVMPIDTPELAALEDLVWALIVSPAGAGGGGFFCIPNSPGSVLLPAVAGEIFYGHRGHICLWGFPSGETVQVTLIDPAGEVFAQDRFLSKDVGNFDFPVADVSLWTAGLQPGQWEVIAESNGTSLSYSLQVSLSQYPRYPVLDVVPFVENYVFMGDRWENYNNNIYQSGDVLQVIGAGFPSNHILAMGIYFSSNEIHRMDIDSINLVYKQAIEVDQSGQLYQQLNVTSDLPPGRYCVIIPITPSYLESEPVYEIFNIPDYNEGGALACFVVEND